MKKEEMLQNVEDLKEMIEAGKVDQMVIAVCDKDRNVSTDIHAESITVLGMAECLKKNTFREMERQNALDVIDKIANRLGC